MESAKAPGLAEESIQREVFVTNATIRLVQFIDTAGRRCVGVSSEGGSEIPLVKGFVRVYDLACEAIRRDMSLGRLARENLSSQTVNLDEVIETGRILAPIDHPDQARCTVSLTGITHMGSAQSRDEMHGGTVGPVTDTSRMFQIGLTSGRPAPGEIGAQPEWAYKGDGRCIVPPEHALVQPAFADDGGEEAEIAGHYIIDGEGNPWRVGFSIGNEFADHVLERKNYLYLAHSKLRQCSFGPELFVGELPRSIGGNIRVVRRGQIVWTSTFESGEDRMCHSIANLEHHHFKYDLFRRPWDLHVHFFGANQVSFGQGFRAEMGDRFEIDVPVFGKPLRNPLVIESENFPVQVKAL
jgi:hypothetical protein